MIIPRTVQLHPIEFAMAEIVFLLLPMFLTWVLFMFIVAMILVPLRILRRAHEKTPGVVRDITDRAKYVHA